MVRKIPFSLFSEKITVFSHSGTCFLGESAPAHRSMVNILPFPVKKKGIIWLKNDENVWYLLK